MASWQTMGAVIGVFVLVLGTWLWRSRGAENSRRGRNAIAALVLALVVAVPIVVMWQPRPSVQVEACVEVETIPGSAGGVGEKRVTYGVRIANVGRSSFIVDSVVLLARRDSAHAWESRSDIVAIADIIRWQVVDSMTRRPGDPRQWSLSGGSQLLRMRSIIVPVEQLRPLYLFRGVVFLGHRDPGRPIVRGSAPNWIDNFQTAENRASTLTAICGDGARAGVR